MKALASTILSVCLLIAGVTCACELQAMPMEPGKFNHADMHQMAQPMPCDHSDCGNGCLATGNFSKPELLPKPVQFIDLEPAVNNSALTYLFNQPLSVMETGPPYFLSTLPSTPVTRRDLLLE